MEWFVVGLFFVFFTLIGLTNFYLYRFYIDEKYVEDYWEFNLKSPSHSKEIFKILLNKTGTQNKNAKRVKLYFMTALCLLLILLYLTF